MAAVPAQERTDLLNFAHKNKPRDYSDSCSVALDHVNSHDLMCKHIVKLTKRLIASKYLLKDLEQLALDWLEDQLTGRTADQWHIVVREASREGTTADIGPNSVLYRTLRDMLLAYPAHSVKATIMSRKATDLVWAPNRTGEEGREECERVIHTDRDWVVWSRSQPRQGDRTLRGFEHVGKAISCGKVKLSKKEQKEPEAEDDVQEDAPDTEVDESGRTCRQKGWWKRGDVEAKLNTAIMTAWVHKECDIMDEDALIKLQEA